MESINKTTTGERFHKYTFGTFFNTLGIQLDKSSFLFAKTAKYDLHNVLNREGRPNKL